MRKLIWPVLFLFLLLLQGMASVFFSGWLSCDPVLLALYAYAVLRGSEAGGIMGFGAGLLQDALTSSIFGYHMLTRGLLAYAVGRLKDKIFKENYFLHIMMIGGCCLALRFCYWWLFLLRTGSGWQAMPSYLWATLGYCAGNMLLAAPAVYMVQRLYEWIKEEDISY